MTDGVLLSTTEQFGDVWKIKSVLYAVEMMPETAMPALDECVNLIKFHITAGSGPSDEAQS